MKKLLIASTALVATAGFAAAELTLSGDANLGVKYNGGLDENEVRLHYEIDFRVTASGTTDGGLTFGASIDLDSSINGEGDQFYSRTVAVDGSGAPAPGLIDGTTSSDQRNEDFNPRVFISGDFGTITAGNLDPAADDIGMKDVGFDGIGIDDPIDAIIVIGTDVGDGFGATANVSYDVTFGGFRFLAAAHTIDEDYGFFAEYDFGTFDVALAYVVDDELTPAAGKGDSITGRVGFEIGDWDTRIFYVTHSNDAFDVDAYGIDVTYVTGAYTITFAAQDTDADEDSADFGIGVSYDLGGGAALAGGIGYSDGLAGGDSEVVADFGINMKF